MLFITRYFLRKKQFIIRIILKRIVFTFMI
jgi:hypothetical protein